MVLPRVMGKLQRTAEGHAVVTVKCPECGRIHRHDLGVWDDPGVESLLAHRVIDAWMACRGDLPGNYYRIVVSASRAKRPSAQASATPAGDTTSVQGDQPTRRRRRRGKRKSAKGAAPSESTPPAPST
jgi:hypothetical protein